ncbi:MAG TPA: ATP synthase F0 subunit B [Candidatus Paceibacterota bacterium]|nr:ATP synthase F0 subunit B [Candidatus Paceibacterota bacterium]
MQQLISQLGIDWHLLISQAVNFALLLIALRFFAYQPLLKLLHERRQRIEEGLTKADEADRRLLEAEQMKKEKIHEGEAKAMSILKKTESDAKELEAKLLAEARRKEAEELAATQATIRAKEEESRRGMEREAAAMVRMAIAKTVELSPDKIDDALIARAVKEVSRS